MDTPIKPIPNGEATKMDGTKVVDSGVQEGTKFGSFTIKTGDAQSAQKLLDIAKTKGYIIDQNGTRHDVNSPSGQKTMKVIKAVGNGTPPDVAVKMTEMQVKTGQQIAKGKAIAANIAKSSPPAQSKPVNNPVPAGRT